MEETISSSQRLGRNDLAHEAWNDGKSIIIVSYHIMSSREGRSGQELEQWYYELN